MLAGLDKAIGVQQPVIAAHVRRIRNRHPEASPRDVLATLEKQYLAAVMASGAAAGGVAAVPVVGTAVSIAASMGDTVGFLEASALFSLAVAEVHGIRIDDIEKRRTLVLAVVLGDSGAKLVEKTAARTGKHWGKLLTNAIPMSSILKINRVLGWQFITKYGTKRGIIVIGRLAPFGIGAGIGGAGNGLFGWSVIRGVRKAFGPPGEWKDTGRDKADQARTSWSGAAEGDADAAQGEFAWDQGAELPGGNDARADAGHAADDPALIHELERLDN